MQACRVCGRDNNCIKILVSKPAGKRPFGRLKLRCRNKIGYVLNKTIEIGLKEIVIESADCILMA
jgi:hypothetical protein